MSALSDLQAFGASCGRLADFAGLAAKHAAPHVEAESKRTAAAGVDPDGKPWPLKKDGGRALANAAEHVSARAVGDMVVIELVGPDNWHQDGAQGKPVRRVIPDTKIPDGIAAAVERGAAEAFAEVMGV